MITIGITSYNRGKYLNALLTSIRHEVEVGNHQVVLVDNGSIEQSVFDAIDSSQQKDRWLDVIYRSPEQRSWTNDEYIAKNIIIERARHPVILFLQDDLQFIGPTGSIQTYANSLIASPYLCLTANGVRRSVLRSKVILNRSTFTSDRFWWYIDGHFHTMGFFKKEIFDEIGQYPVNWPTEQLFWGRSEDWYDARVKERYKRDTISATHQVPLFLPVWNDPRGGYAFIRGNKRYGHYNDPVDHCGLYYGQMSSDRWMAHYDQIEPCSFMEVAQPLGWTIAVDTNNGSIDHKKYPQDKMIIEGPISEIDS